MVIGQSAGVQPNPLIANLTTVPATSSATQATRPQDAAYALRFPDAARAEVHSTAEAELRLVVPAVERLEAKAANEGLTPAETASLRSLKTQAQSAMNRFALSSEGGATLRSSGLATPGAGLDTQVSVAEAYARGAQDLVGASPSAVTSVPDAAERLRSAAGAEGADRIIDNAIAVSSLKHIPESVVSGDERREAVTQLGGGGQRAYVEATKDLRPWWQPPHMATKQLEARGTADLLQEASLDGVPPRDRVSLEYGATVARGRELMPEAYSEVSGGALGVALGPMRRGVQNTVGEGVEQAVEQGARQATREAGQQLALEAPGATAAARRASPGTAVGSAQLQRVEGQWLKGSQSNFGKIPKQVAEALEGREFSSFNGLRKAVWKEVPNHPELAKQFQPSDVARMRKGIAPLAPPDQHLGKQSSYVLHHTTPIHEGGGVYSMDNLSIVTPRLHKEILDPAYHYGR